MRKVTTLLVFLLILGNFSYANDGKHETRGGKSLFIESFEAYQMPDNWTIHDENNDYRFWEAQTTNTYTGAFAAGISNAVEGANNDWLVTPAILPEDDFNTISFWARSGSPVPIDLEDFVVRLSTTDKQPGSFTTLLDSITEAPNQWTEYNYDLSEYVGQKVYVAIISVSNQKFHFCLDDVEAPYFYWDYDMKTVNLYGNTIPEIGQPQEYKVVTENFGWENIEDYSVELVEQGGDPVAVVDGLQLGSMETDTVSLTWTPQELGTKALYARIVCGQDENMDNNFSPVWNLSVQSENLIPSSVGKGDFYDFWPIFYPFRTSLSETIYYDDEVTQLGNIKSLVYHANFTYPIVEKPIRVWVGETDKTSLEHEWIPASELELVYEGTLSIPAGEYDIPITLQNEYQYTGNNLVVMIERSWDERQYGYENTYLSSETDEYRIRHYRNNFEETDPNNPSNDPFWTHVAKFIPDVDIYFDTEGMGSLAGNLLDSETAPLADATVSLTGIGATAISTNDGYYEFPYMYAGDYEATASKFGYYDATESVTVNSGEPTYQDFFLEKLPEVEVAGMVAGSDDPNTGLEGAVVTLNGYDNYAATTGDDGNFTFDNVYGGNKEYTLTIECEGYELFETSVVVEDESMDLGTVVIDEIAYPALNVEAMEECEDAYVSWMAAGSITPEELRHDDGTFMMPLGFQGGPQKPLFGSVYRNDALITEVSWYLTSEEIHDEVQIFILGLDESNAPTMEEVLYQSEMIPNTDDQWNTFELPAPVQAPNGYFVGVSTPGQFTALGMDDGIGAPYEFDTLTHYACYNYEDPMAWMDIAQQGYQGNFMIRTMAYNFGSIERSYKPGMRYGKNYPELMAIKSEQSTPDAPAYQTLNRSKSGVESYTLYALLEGEENQPEQWSEVATGIELTEYTDTEWSTYESGVYRYAVVADYAGGIHATPSFSNTLPNGMEVNANFKFFTNDSGDPDGAIVELINNDGNPEHVYVDTAGAMGMLSMEDIWKGRYDMTVSLEGYETFNAQELPFLTDTMVMLTLNEKLITPFNVQAEVLGAHKAELSWNNYPSSFNEGFENYEDFSADMGDIQLIDSDELPTWEITDFDFPGEGEEMSYITFNPSKTTPPCDDWVIPHSGEKLAVAINSQMEPNNDWMIFPKMTATDPMEITFWAKSMSSNYNWETVTVMVSESGTEPGDFVPVSEEIMVHPYEWTMYNFDLSAYAGKDIHVALHCTSMDAFGLMIDDIEIGEPLEKGRSLVQYHITLDGAEFATTSAENYILEGLEANTTYEAGLYAEYETGNTDTVYVSFTTDMNVGMTNAEEVFAMYPNPANDRINLDYPGELPVEMVISDMTGRVVLQQRLKNSHNSVLVSNLEPGTYLVRLIGDNQTKTTKLIVR